MGNCFKELEAMGSTPTKRLVISGYYGFDNSGDEAVLQSILIALEEQGRAQGTQIVPVVLSANPEHTSRMYGVEAVPRMKPLAVIKALRSADGLISGGGSLLQDATSSRSIPYYLMILKLAQWLRKPTFIYSQGIGPVHNPWYHRWIRSTFAKCTYISVRDVESAALLARMGVAPDRVEVVPDPVMGLPLREGGGIVPHAAARAGEAPADAAVPRIGVSVRFWNPNRSELQALAEALRLLQEQRQVELRFLPFHLPSDEQASEFTLQAAAQPAGASPSVSGLSAADASPSVSGLSAAEASLSVSPAAPSITRGISSPQDMLAAVSECDLLIGMRLHALIYAASQEVPMVGISYDPKIDQFLNRLGMKAAASNEHFNIGVFLQQTLQLLDHRQAWVDEKAGLIASLRADAQQPAERIVAFMREQRMRSV
jgi:polysaccharide pyruvyl transferase CsaB